MKILLADDDIFFTKIIGRQIRKAGYELIIVHDGEAAFNAIEKEKPNLVFLDLMMPKMGGFDVLEKMKTVAGLTEIPVIIMTNLGQDSDIEKGLALGAKEYFVKSDFSISEFVSKIKQYLK